MFEKRTPCHIPNRLTLVVRSILHHRRRLSYELNCISFLFTPHLASRALFTKHFAFLWRPTPSRRFALQFEAAALFHCRVVSISFIVGNSLEPARRDYNYPDGATRRDACNSRFNDVALSGEGMPLDRIVGHQPIGQFTLYPSVLSTAARRRVAAVSAVRH
jgi:hypothetical protein